MIEKVSPKQKITATKMNKIISSVNRHDDILKKQTVSPIPLQNGKAHAEMYFHVVQTAEAFTFSNPDYQASENEQLYLGACIYTGGEDNISNLILVDDVPIKEVYQVKDFQNNTFEHLSATFEACDNKFGPYCPIYTFHQDNNKATNTITVGVGEIDDDQHTKVAIIFSYNSSNELPPDLKENFPFNDTNSVRLTRWRTIFSVDKFSNNDGVYTDKPNQYHLGQLTYNFNKDYMFLDCDTLNDNDSIKWKVYIGQAADDSGLTCFAFDDGEVNDMVPYPHDDGWVYLNTPADEALWGIIYGDSQKGKKLYLGKYQELVDAPSYPYGGEFLPSLGPFPIARYNSDTYKITQIFHGLPLNTYILPDTSLECNDLYGDLGTDFSRFKSLEITKNINYKDGKFGNYMNLYKFNSKDSDYNACIPKEAQWFKIGVFDSEEGTSASLFGNYSKNKTMLIRDEFNDIALLDYNYPALDVQSLSSYFNKMWDDRWEEVSTDISPPPWDCNAIYDCRFVLTNVLSNDFVSPYDLSTTCWLQGADAGTNYGSSIGNSEQQKVIDLDNMTFDAGDRTTTINAGRFFVHSSSTECDGDLTANGMVTCKGVTVTNQDVTIINGVVFIQTGDGAPALVIDGRPYAPRTITDGAGNEIKVLAAL